MKRLLLILLPALLSFSCRHRSDLPRLFAVPSATLIDPSGRPVSLDANKGYVTVYDFIFTSCTGSCPIMTNNMRALVKKVPRDVPVRFVSISVDPARDTPAVLADYARKVRTDERWTFLTGDRASIVKLSVDGFKLAAGDPAPGGEPLLHSAKFAVADKRGVIRLYADGSDGGVADSVWPQIEDLLRED